MSVKERSKIVFFADGKLRYTTPDRIEAVGSGPVDTMTAGEGAKVDHKKYTCSQIEATPPSSGLRISCVAYRGSRAHVNATMKAHRVGLCRLDLLE